MPRSRRTRWRLKGEILFALFGIWAGHWLALEWGWPTLLGEILGAIVAFGVVIYICWDDIAHRFEQRIADEDSDD